MCHEEEWRKEHGLSYRIFVDFVTGVLMPEGLVLCRGWEILLVDLIHPVLLPEVVDKDGGEVMIIPAHIPADGGFGPGFFPFGVIGEAQEEPEESDEDDGC